MFWKKEDEIDRLKMAAREQRDAAVKDANELREARINNGLLLEELSLSENKVWLLESLLKQLNIPVKLPVRKTEK